MAAKKKAVRKSKPAAKARKTARLWLMFPPKLITKPVVWELSKKFPVVTIQRREAENKNEQAQNSEYVFIHYDRVRRRPCFRWPIALRLPR